MSALHVIAEWALIGVGGLLVLVIVGAALHLVALAAAVCPPEPPVRVRRKGGYVPITPIDFNNLPKAQPYAPAVSQQPAPAADQHRMGGEP